ncbi:MAG: YafY family protein [Gammaproteobacteria bacterium]
MEKFHRIFELHQIFSNRRTPISLKDLNEKLGCSESTTRRAVSFLRDSLNAPLSYDREHNGWSYNHQQNQQFDFPGLWFNPEELYALLVSYHLLSNLQPGFLSEQIAPLQTRMEQLLVQQNIQTPVLKDRIRILQIAARPNNIENFRKIAASVLRREQLKILYHGRERDSTIERQISPQRLVYYRSNWYLDAWCHLRNGLRIFSLDRLHAVAELGKKAKNISNKELNEKLASAYGIFSGEPEHKAILNFSAEAARWVADEQWHPQQTSKANRDGSYELTIPYNDPRELVMDILKYGPDVEVKAPRSLRKRVQERLQQAIEKY